MRRYIAHIFVICGLILPSLLMAQDETDALRYSTTTLTGTARALGMGGAFSAVGADLTAASLNPAGLGLFRHSEAAITPVLRGIDVNSNFLGESSNSSIQKLGVGNWGFAFQNQMFFDDGRQYRPAEKGLVSYTFAFGQNQVENYQREFSTSAFNPHSSITDRFTEMAQGRSPNEFNLVSIPGMAFNTFAIDTVSNRDGATYFPAVNGGRIQQEVRVEETGQRNEWFASLAGNFDDFLYVGLTVGIQSLRYERTFTHREEDTESNHQFFVPDPDDPDFDLETSFNSLVFSERLLTRGTGINAKLGVIVRPSDVFRVGVSIQSPTYFLITEQYNPSISHNFNEDADALNEGSSPVTFQEPQNPATGEFEYNLSTPFQMTLGGMYLFGKNGFISADVEFTDYGATRFSDSDESAGESFATENNRITELFKSAINYRVGGEYRYSIFRFRAGAAYYSNAYNEEALAYQDASLETRQLDNPNRLIFTAGAGIRQPNFSVDVSWVGQQQTEKFNPYSSATGSFFEPSLVNEQNKQSVYITLGFSI